MNVLATRRGSAHYPSMLEDVEARRPTEIDLITGSLVREAEQLGVPVPLHTALYRLIRAREASWRQSGPHAANVVRGSGFDH
jgi:2-dehydropantoate 2-reductase